MVEVGRCRVVCVRVVGGKEFRRRGEVGRGGASWDVGGGVHERTEADRLFPTPFRYRMNHKAQQTKTIRVGLKDDLIPQKILLDLRWNLNLALCILSLHARPLPGDSRAKRTPDVWLGDNLLQPL